jgi:hypothetical protein
MTLKIAEPMKLKAFTGGTAASWPSSPDAADKTE